MPHQGSLVIAPNRQPVHLGGLSFDNLLGILPLRVSCFSFLEREVAQMVVPLHQFSLVISGGKGDVFICSNWWQWIKNEGPMANGLVRGGDLVRWVRYIRHENPLNVFVDLFTN